MAGAELTLIVPCGDDVARVDFFLDHLARTQPVERVELIVVQPAGRDHRPAAPDRFAGFHSIALPAADSLDDAMAQAVRAASNDIVVLLEDHVRPDGTWVDGLVKLFRDGPWDAVGWTMLPADVRSRISWSGFLAEYGPWGPGVPRGEVRDHLPGHNGAYRRSTLLSLDSDLPLLLRGESLLHWRLLADGHRLYFTDEFQNHHEQYDSFRLLLATNFWYGRLFGDARRRTGGWRWPRRLSFALALPVKPLFRWRALLRAPLDRAQLPRAILARCAPEITLTWLAGAAGESLGVLFGPGGAARRSTHYKLAVPRRAGAR